MTEPSRGRHRRPRLFARTSLPETARVAEALRAETTGGMLLLAAAVVALLWANSGWGDSYVHLRDHVVGPSWWDLELSLGAWAADGLLAIFFFVAGLEVKREFVSGDLRDPRRAALPVVAAVCGMAVPAAIYVCWTAGTSGVRGWAIPTATDIAFALAILAVIGRHLPSGLRTFLLTLAVVDDLLAICVIAFFYTDSVDLPALIGALVPIALFGVVIRSRLRSPWLLVPLAAAAWILVHASGVHATVAGVALALTVPAATTDDQPSLAERCEHLLRPLSAGIAVPVFAFFSAGVAVGGMSGLGAALGDHLTLGIITGLVVGKTIGIAGSTWLLATFTGADLDDELGWIDVVGVSILAGVGFTVSLLIGELAFGTGTSDDHVKVGVLAASVIAAGVAAVVLGLRGRHYRQLGSPDG